MSATKKQLAANRRNCKKSTGPKTDAGKAAVSQNGIKHGLYSGNVIINSQHLQESQADYDALVAALVTELRPEGLLQNLLVRKIANCFWRYRRVINAETARINRRINGLDSDLAFADAILNLGGKKKGGPAPANDDKHGTNEMDNLVNIRSLPDDSSSRLMLRYEMRFDRQLARSLRLLAQLKREAWLEGENEITSGTPKNDDSKPISCNSNDDNQLSENLPPDHPCDSMEVAPRHPSPRRVPPRYTRQHENDDSNPISPNHNTDNELCENLPLDHLCDSIKPPPRWLAKKKGGNLPPFRIE